METVQAGAEPVKRERDIERVYRTVNETWQGKGDRQTSDYQVRLAARGLYRYMTGKKFTGKIVVKHRGRSWVYSNIIIGNSFQSWHDLIHDWSHDIHKRFLHRGKRQHHATHAYVERNMIEEVLRRGYQEKCQRPVKAREPRDLKSERKANLLSRLTAWERRAKRADTAIKKLKRQLAYYERQAMN